MVRGCMRPRWAAFSLLVFAATAQAQAPQRAVVSLSDGGALPGGAVADDEELIEIGGAAGPRRFLNDQTLALYFGDGNGDGVPDEPNDIDALELVLTDGGEPLVVGLYFSLVSDQAGFKDGDILRFDPKGPAPVAVHLDEAFLATAVGADDGNIDVDGIAFMTDGTLLFSLAEDEPAGGIVWLDEDVLALAPGAVTASLFAGGAQVGAWVKNALGTTVAVGDVKALEWHDGNLLFTVQSPSSDDGTVFTSAGGGAVFSGLAEGALGFLSDVEVDALALPPGAGFPDIDLDQATAREGDPRALQVEGLAPFEPFMVLAAATPRLAGTMSYAGFGALAMDPTDPLYLAGLASPGGRIGVSDAAGRALFTGAAPANGGLPFDVALQIMGASGRSISNPVVLAVNR